MRFRIISAAREHNGHTRAHHDPCRLGFGEMLQLFGQHVARFQVWHDQTIRLPGHRGGNPFDRCCLRRDSVIEGQKDAVTMKAVCPFLEMTSFHETKGSGAVRAVPRRPTDGMILTRGIVGALPGTSGLSAAYKQGHTLRELEDG